MSIFDDLKSVANVLRKADKIKEVQQILDIQGELLDYQKRISDLESENKDLKEKLDLRRKVHFERNACWKIKEDGSKEGPYCHHCWEINGKLIHLRAVEGDRSMRRHGFCSECNDHPVGMF